MNTLWAFAAVLATFPVMGLICATACQDATLFCRAGIFVPIAVVVVPVVTLAASLAWQPLLIIGPFVSLFMRFRGHKK